MLRKKKHGQKKKNSLVHGCPRRHLALVPCLFFVRAHTHQGLGRGKYQRRKVKKKKKKTAIK